MPPTFESFCNILKFVLVQIQGEIGLDIGCQISFHEHRFNRLPTGTLGSGHMSGKETPACLIVGSITGCFVIGSGAGVKGHRSGQLGSC